MRLLTKPLHHAAGIQRLISFLIYLYIRLVRLTNSWQVIGRQYPEAYWSSGKPFIVCFWHNRLLMTVYAWESLHPFFMLMSGHSDGEMIAKVVARFGVKHVAGSSRKGGLAAFRHLLKILASGGTVGITPDGPKGPRYETKDGIVALSLLSGCDILPLAFSTSRHKTLSSWDRFVLPLPWGRGCLVWGPALSPQNYTGQSDQFRQDITQALLDVTQKADTLCGVPPC